MAISAKGLSFGGDLGSGLHFCSLGTRSWPWGLWAGLGNTCISSLSEETCQIPAKERGACWFSSVKERSFKNWRKPRWLELTKRSTKEEKATQAKRTRQRLRVLWSPSRTQSDNPCEGNAWAWERLIRDELAEPSHEATQGTELSLHHQLKWKTA